MSMYIILLPSSFINDPTEKIASFSQPAVAMAKETVNASYELNLEEVGPREPLHRIPSSFL